MSVISRWIPFACAVGAAMLTACQSDELTSAPDFAVRRNSSTALVIENTNDAGPGSLRQAIENAAHGSVITVPSALASQAIVLLSPIVIDKPLTVEGPMAGRLLIVAPANARALGIATDGAVTIRRLAITGGHLLSTPSDPLAPYGTTGGGVQISAGSATVDDCEIFGNEASAGGGIAVLPGASLFMYRTLVRDNHATTSGGVASYSGSVLHLLESTVRNNAATLYGAGLGAHGSTLVERSTIAANVGASLGGGMIVSGPTTLRNSTVVSNSAGSGGGFFVEGGSLQLVHVSVIGNQASSGNALAGAAERPVVVHNSILVGADDECQIIVPVFTGRNIAGDPSCGLASDALKLASPQTLVPADNGGPTQTSALLENSPAIDGGSACTELVDQRGIARPQGVTCDIGAFEFDDFVRITHTVNASGTVFAGGGRVLLTGRVTCSRSLDLPVDVRLDQAQKVGRTAYVLTSTTRVSVSCIDGTGAWSAFVAPTDGAYKNAAATVMVSSGAIVPALAASATATVKLTWSK